LTPIICFYHKLLYQKKDYFETVINRDNDIISEKTTSDKTIKHLNSQGIKNTNISPTIEGMESTIHETFVSSVINSSITNEEPVVETARRSLNYSLGSIRSAGIIKYIRPVTSIAGVYLDLVNKRKLGDLRVYFSHKTNEIRHMKKVKQGTPIYD